MGSADQANWRLEGKVASLDDAPLRRTGQIAVLLLHSLVDYPERSLSLAVVTGLLAGLLGRLGIERSGRS